MMDMSRLRSLDRRLWILPLLSLITTAAVLIPLEIGLKRLYPDQEIDSCINVTATVPYAKPNCISHVKVAEGPWVENHYNECGFRSPNSCGAASGSERVAIIGSSMGAGFFVPEPESLSGLLPKYLEKACGRAFQTQNLALPDFPVAQLAASAKKALALNPSLLLITVSSYDIEKSSDGRLHSAKPFIKTVIEAVEQPFKNSTTAYMAKEIFLSNDKDYNDFIAGQQQPAQVIADETRDGLAVLSMQIDQIVQLNQGRGIPIVVTFIPRREEIVRERVWPGYSDPAAAALQRIADGRGIPFINGLNSIPRSAPTAPLYYVANHHMNGTGDQYIAQGMLKGLVALVPAFSGCHRS